MTSSESSCYLHTTTNNCKAIFARLLCCPRRYRYPQVRSDLFWLLHTELHCLDIPERVTYKLGVIMFGCQRGRAPQYLIDYCLPVFDVASRSASRPLPVVPHHRLSTYGRRAFAVAGPTVWNSLPDNLRYPDLSTDNFKRLLKTFLFSVYQYN